MRHRQRQGFVGIATLLVVLAAAAPALAQFPTPQTGPQPAPAPAPPPGPAPQPGQPAQPPHPRAAELKSRLERAGLKVLEVDYAAAQQGRPPVWFAATQATYAQPSIAATNKQAGLIWEVMRGLLGQDPPQTFLLGGQAWSKYLILFGVPLGTWSRLMRVAQSGGSEAERRQASDAFNREARVAVYDLQRGQFVDTKDFVNKNFVGD